MKYELPDHTKSLVWSERKSPDEPIRFCTYLNCRWIDYRRNACEPDKGDWLPWTPPVFPERVKLRRRRGWATVDGVRALVHTDIEGLGYWYTQTSCSAGNKATDIDWIDPEYIDELPPDPRGVT